jgi:membrane protein implicated in regulation of membrane protease activity
MASEEAKKGLAILIGGILLVVGMLLMLVGFKFHLGAFMLPSVIPAMIGYLMLRWVKNG